MVALKRHRSPQTNTVLIAEKLGPFMDIKKRVQRAVANGLLPALSRTGALTCHPQ